MIPALGAKAENVVGVRYPPRLPRQTCQRAKKGPSSLEGPAAAPRSGLQRWQPLGRTWPPGRQARHKVQMRHRRAVENVSWALPGLVCVRVAVAPPCETSIMHPTTTTPSVAGTYRRRGRARDATLIVLIIESNLIFLRAGGVVCTCAPFPCPCVRQMAGTTTAALGKVGQTSALGICSGAHPRRPTDQSRIFARQPDLAGTRQTRLPAWARLVVSGRFVHLGAICSRSMKLPRPPLGSLISSGGRKETKLRGSVRRRGADVTMP
jgi:hypothetical protein